MIKKHLARSLYIITSVLIMPLAILFFYKTKRQAVQEFFKYADKKKWN